MKWKISSKNIVCICQDVFIVKWYNTTGYSALSYCVKLSTEGKHILSIVQWTGILHYSIVMYLDQYILHDKYQHNSTVYYITIKYCKVQYCMMKYNTAKFRGSTVYKVKTALKVPHTIKPKIGIFQIAKSANWVGLYQCGDQSLISR